MKVERDGRVTQARSLREVDSMARDLIVSMTDAAPNSVELNVEVALPPSVNEHVAKPQQLRDQATRSHAEAAQECRLGGISHQRAAQLIAP